MAGEVLSPRVPDMDQDEFAEWFQSLDDSVPRNNADQVDQLLTSLAKRPGRYEARLASP
ncbi:MAG: hypothetical protein ACQESR_09995 [Planctomycetota bacterium]